MNLVMQYQIVYLIVKYLKKNISLKGGVAYVDLSGDCVPDIIFKFTINPLKE